MPEYWLVDRRRGLVEVRTEPAGDVDRRVTPYRKGETITLQQLADVVSPVDAILR